MIRCVIFDIDNTLYSYTKANAAAMQGLYAYAGEWLGLSAAEFDKLAAKASKGISDRLSLDNATVHNRLIRFQNILEDLGLPLYPHAVNLYYRYWDTFLDNMECAPDCRELMQRLAKRRIRIGIGTDMTALMQYRKLEKLDLLPLVQFIVTSEEAGEEKPGSQFFELCIQKAECVPEECLFIGDNPKKDILGAVNARMKALWYNPDEKALPGDVEMDIRKNIGTVCKCIGNYREVIDRLDDYLG